MEADGCLFPSFSMIREVSLQIAAAVAEGIIKAGRATAVVKSNNSGSEESIIKEMCRDAMYDPLVD